MFTKEEISARVKELENALTQQTQLVQQVNNQILMIHGAKEELNLMMKKLEEKEKIELEKQEESRDVVVDAA